MSHRSARSGSETAGPSGHRLDWKRPGLSAGGRRVVHAVTEALLADEGPDGALIPGPRDACERSVAALDDSLGRGSADLRRGFRVLTFALEWLPLFILGVPSRMSRLPMDQRVQYLEALESSRFGLLTMLLVAFKVPLCIPAFEEGDELKLTGFDRSSTTSRRRLPVQPEPIAPAPPAPAAPLPAARPQVSQPEAHP
jgi:hypothetical protein